MTDEIKKKLQAVYDRTLAPCKSVYEVISDYFTEELTDFQVISFEKFLCRINTVFLRTLLNYFDVSKEEFCKAHDIPVSALSNEDTLSQPFITSAYAGVLIDNLPLLFIDEVMEPTPVILIRFPHVRVTNENDRHVDIDELYVKIPLNWDGTMVCKFSMVRTSYDITQWLCSYAHSHLPRASNPPRFEYPCLGTGPINGTIHRIKNSCDLDFWGLFCLELAKYVTVESLAGGPYFRLEDIGMASISHASEPRLYNNNYFPDTRINFKGFLKYFIGLKNTKFAYSNNAYTLGESSLNFWIRVSNEFIKWYNFQYAIGAVPCTLDTLITKGTLISVRIIGGKAYKDYGHDKISTLNEDEGTKILTFKGEDKNLTITGDKASNSNTSLLIDINMCSYIISTILKLVNCNYGREEKNGETETRKKCKYI